MIGPGLCTMLPVACMYGASTTSGHVAYLYRAMQKVPCLLSCTGARHGVEVKAAETDPITGEVTLGVAFIHMVMLAGIYADSPARAKLMYTVASWTAFFVCPFCKLMGTVCDSVVRYLGYAKPAPVTKGHDAGSSFQMGVEDGRMFTREPEQRVRAQAAEVLRVAGGAADSTSMCIQHTCCLPVFVVNHKPLVPLENERR